MNLKNLLLLYFFVLLRLSVFAQDYSRPQAEEENEAAPVSQPRSVLPEVKSRQFKINFLAPGVEYEQKLSKYLSLNTAFYTGFYLSFTNETADFFIFPTIEGQLRGYYNFQKRSESGKNTKNNSANFVALHGSYLFKPIVGGDNSFIESVWFLGPVWGINRTYKSGFSLTLTLGLAYFEEKYAFGGFVLKERGATIIGDLRLGFTLSRDR